MTEVTTDSHIEIKPVYRAEDAGAQQPDPGQYPYTRGVQAKFAFPVQLQISRVFWLVDFVALLCVVRLAREAGVAKVVAALAVVRFALLPGGPQLVEGGLEGVQRGVGGGVHTGQCSAASGGIQR